MNRRVVPLLALLVFAAVIGTAFLIGRSPREKSEIQRTVATPPAENSPVTVPRQDTPANPVPTVTATTAAISRVPVVATSSRPLTADPQPGHFHGITVSHVPAPEKTLPPPGTPRTPLVWKRITTASGKELLAATPDDTWLIPLRSKQVPK